MDAEELALVLLQLRERTAGDDEAYDEAVSRLKEKMAAGDFDAAEGEGG